MPYTTLKLAIGLAIVLLAAPHAAAKPPEGTGGELKPADYERINATFARTVEGDGYDNPPKALKGYSPLYPASRLLSGISGRCTLAFTVSEAGTAVDIAKENPRDDEKMCAHAVYALKLWQFEPARRDGVAVPVRFTMPFGYSAR